MPLPKPIAAFYETQDALNRQDASSMGQLGALSTILGHIQQQKELEQTAPIRRELLTQQAAKAKAEAAATAMLGNMNLADADPTTLRQIGARLGTHPGAATLFKLADTAEERKRIADARTGFNAESAKPSEDAALAQFGVTRNPDGSVAPIPGATPKIASEDQPGHVPLTVDALNPSRLVTLGADAKIPATNVNQVLARAAAVPSATSVSKVPSGYRPAPGGLEPIPGGPADKPAKTGLGSTPIPAPEPGSLEDKALDAQAWRRITTGQLQYRKGSGGGADLNQIVDRRVAEIADKIGMTPQELSAQPAAFKADAQSLSTQVKRLDAIGSVLSSFHNNVDTWDNIAKGIKPVLGGKRVDDFAKDLEKINFIGIQSLDEVKLKIQQQFNDPTVSAYMVAAMSVAMDYARIMQGPQSIASLTEGARKDAERLIRVGVDDKARAGILASFDSDTQGQMKGLEDQANKIRIRMGLRGGRTAADRTVLPPATPGLSSDNPTPATRGGASVSNW